MKDRLLIKALKLLPKNVWSRAVGALAHARLPRVVARPSVRWFATLYGINVNEAEFPISEYRTIGDFFTRRLKTGARSIDRRPGIAISPADGHILNSGRLENGRLIQAKGRHFSIVDLLRDRAMADKYTNGSWVTVYLSPRDYHRVHHPVEGVLTQADYVPGYLWPVNRAAVENIDELFCVNERVVTYVESPIGSVATIMVGATSVGHISLAYDPNLHTNRGLKGGARYYNDDLRVARADELGTFHLGSTAIVLFSNPDVELQPLEAGQPINIGQVIARLP